MSKQEPNEKNTEELNEHTNVKIFRENLERRGLSCEYDESKKKLLIKDSNSKLIASRLLSDLIE